MRRGTRKVWKAVPLPFEFHTALEAGDWLKALQVYQQHPFNTPPVDTFDLLKAVMHGTGVRADDVKSRFNEKIRLSAIMQRRAPEEVEWGVFWEALNMGDMRVVNLALKGARLSSTVSQVGVAEACAVLLRSSGPQWYEKLVEGAPFSTVTRHNLVNIALEQQRWDIAAELLQYVRLNRADVGTMWPLIRQFTWEKVLSLISCCPKNAVPYDVALTYILEDGCDLNQLSEHLEYARVLGDVDVVSPLLKHAIKVENWDFVQRGMEHLMDIGQVTPTSLRAFTHMCKVHGAKMVCKRLQEHEIALETVAVENLELLRL